MNGLEWLLKLEPVALIVLLVIVLSLAQGFFRGASNSARGLIMFVWDGVTLIVSLLLSWRIGEAFSDSLRGFLMSHVTVPERSLNSLEQIWYTFVTSVRDFALLRFGILFLVGYMLLRFVLTFLTPLIGLIVSIVTKGEAREHKCCREK